MPSYIVQITSDGNRKPQFVASVPDTLKGTCEIVSDVQDAFLFNSVGEAHSLTMPLILTRTAQGYLTGWFRKIVGMRGRVANRFSIELTIIETSTAMVKGTVLATVIRGVGISTKYTATSQG